MILESNFKVNFQIRNKILNLRIQKKERDARYGRRADDRENEDRNERDFNLRGGKGYYFVIRLQFRQLVLLKGVI
jgi:hypothetical protein